MKLLTLCSPAQGLAVILMAVTVFFFCQLSRFSQTWFYHINGTASKYSFMLAVTGQSERFKYKN